jgi:hypothetical protein
MDEDKLLIVVAFISALVTALILGAGCTYVGTDVSATRYCYEDPSYNGFDVSVSVSFGPKETEEADE